LGMKQLVHREQRITMTTTVAVKVTHHMGDNDD
jgi:hypothetical protein